MANQLTTLSWSSLRFPLRLVLVSSIGRSATIANHCVRIALFLRQACSCKETINNSNP